MAAVTPADSSPAVSGRVFFSCAPEDETEARRLATAFAGHGLPIIPLVPANQRSTPAGIARVQREIRACDLFLPIISSHSEKNPEGPFRQEWQTAVECAAAKTDSLPFLIPLVLDNLPAGTARVPEAFRSVPWFPLPAVDEEAALTARLQEMLRQYDSLRLRQGRPVAAPSWVLEPEAPSAPAPAPRRFGPLIWAALALGVVAIGGAAFFMMRKPAGVPAKPPQSNPTVAAPASTPTRAPAAARGPLEATRILLATFNNLTGDPVLDTVGQRVSGDLTRALARAAGFQVLSGTAGDLAAGVDAARRAGAAILVTGSYTQNDKNFQLRTQITLVASGVSFGTLGPVSLDDTVSGSALTEFVERVTTGVCEASALVQNAPPQPSKEIYSRAWARWPMTQQARALGDIPLVETERRISEAKAILRTDPAMLGVKLYLARALCDGARYDEAEVIYAELFNQRGLISESELFDLLYDRSLLLGNIDTALSAARQRTEFHPRDGSIDDVVSCLFALNRPADALQEFTEWLNATGPTLGPVEMSRRQNEQATIAVIAEIRRGETAKAQVGLAALKNRLGPNGSLATLQLESLVLARAGSQADYDRLLDRVSDLPSIPVLEPVRMAYNFHCQFLHVGRTDEAAHFLDRAKRLWTALPPAAYSPTSAESILLEADLALAQNRPLDALAALDRASAKIVAAHALDFDGRRALALQDLGRTGDFSRLLAKLEAIDPRNSRGLPRYWRARLAARAGLQKGAVELLRLAVARGLWLDDYQHFATSYGRCEPEFAALRGSPLYEDLVRPKS